MYDLKQKLNWKTNQSILIKYMNRRRRIPYVKYILFYYSLWKIDWKYIIRYTWFVNKRKRNPVRLIDIIEFTRKQKFVGQNNKNKSFNRTFNYKIFLLIESYSSYALLFHIMADCMLDKSISVLQNSILLEIIFLYPCYWSKFNFFLLLYW